MTDKTTRAAAAPALGPLHRARIAPDRGRRRGARSGSMRHRKSACAPMPGARRKRNPAASMIAPSARWPVSRSASKCAARTPASRWCRRPPRNTLFTAKLGEILVVAQIYDPKLVIAEFKAPASIADARQPGAAAGRLEQGARQRGGVARGAAARLDRVRRRRASTASTQFAADAGRARQACRTAWPPRGRLADAIIP